MQTSVAAGTLSVIGQTRWVHVASVFDGDTFRTSNGEKIRLLGINTAEVAHGNQSPQPYGREAKRRLSRLIAGQSVQLRMDKDKRDQYGRTLAQVYLRDGRWVNQILVREGLAQVYTFAPNFYWTEALLRSEAIARNDMLGMWKAARFRVLDAKTIKAHHIGQFRIVRGYVGPTRTWRFKLGASGKPGKLSVSVPRAYRQWFSSADMPRQGQKVLIRGTIRTSTRGQLYLALHSPFDMKKAM